MYHATTTDIPLRHSWFDTLVGIWVWVCLAPIAVVVQSRPSAYSYATSSQLEDLMLLAVLLPLLGVVLGIVLLRVFKRRVRFEGPSYRGHIESKLGESAPLEVIWGRLHAVPFVVRLEDGRAALVKPVALALETNEQDQEIGVGAQIEIIGTPRWTADAPRAAYRESTVMCFAGQPTSPVGIRLR